MLLVPDIIRDIQEWNPWEEIKRIQEEMNRVLSGVQSGIYVHEYPLINIWKNEDKVVVTAEIPGVDADKIQVSVEGDILRIAGEREQEDIKEGNYHRQERGYGKFSREIKLPFRVDAEKVDAKYSKGILTISLERHEDEKPKQITIKKE